MEITFMNDFVQIVAHLVTIGGVPLAIWLYLQEKRRERHERAYGAWHALDSQYLRFLELCLARPDLDVLDLPVGDGGEPTNDQIRQEQILFRMLITLLERAFVMYHEQTTDVEERQWGQWLGYMKDFATRENFRLAWPQLSQRFDSDFVGFMDELMAPEVRLECPMSFPIN
jgi:hypothetical protein